MIVETLKTVDIKGEELSSISGTPTPGKLFSGSAGVPWYSPNAGMYILEHRCALMRVHTHRHTHTL